MKRLALVLVLTLCMSGVSYAMDNTSSFSDEAITVSTTAIGFTAANIATAASGHMTLFANSATCCTEGATVRYRIMADPTGVAGGGALISSGSCFTVNGYSDISRIKFIRISTASTDATMFCTYSK